MRDTTQDVFTVEEYGFLASDSDSNAQKNAGVEFDWGANQIIVTVASVVLAILLGLICYKYKHVR